jgi:tRNA threonylcarbamoyladenosine modification (KEOPS) complex  Pcc1 subunit
LVTVKPVVQAAVQGKVVLEVRAYQAKVTRAAIAHLLRAVAAVRAVLAKHPPPLL